MAIDFVKKQKSQKKLLIVLFSVIVVVAAVLWFGFFRETTPYAPESGASLPREVRINFEALDKIKNFQPFVFIEPLAEEEGRDNPFLPY
jgi:flagellar basal body-associated protein FliL